MLKQLHLTVITTVQFQLEKAEEKRIYQKHSEQQLALKVISTNICNC